MIVGLRGPGLNLFCAVGMFFAGTLFSAPPAAADDGESCVKESGDIAIAACSRAITSGRYSAHGLAIIYVSRGAEYVNKGQHDRAIQDYDQAIRLDQQYSLAFSDRGAAYGIKGQHDRAIKDFDQAIRLNAQNTMAFYNRGFEYAAKGQYDRAIQDYDQAIQLNPQYARAFYRRGVAKKAKGDTASGDADIAKARQLEPDIGQ